MIPRKHILPAVVGLALLSGFWWWRKQPSFFPSQELAAGSKSRFIHEARVVNPDQSRRVTPHGVTRSELKSAMQQELPARTPNMLKLLEELQREPFDQELRSIYQSIFDQGNLNESHAAMSLLEQREERDSVRFLASLLRHSDEQIRHRAWMACEAIAGQTMKSDEEITAWAESWNPDPAIQELMTSQQETMVPSATVPHPSQKNITDRKKKPLGEWKPQVSPKAED